MASARRAACDATSCDASRVNPAPWLTWGGIVERVTRLSTSPLFPWNNSSNIDVFVEQRTDDIAQKLSKAIRVLLHQFRSFLQSYTLYLIKPFLSSVADQAAWVLYLDDLLRTTRLVNVFTLHWYKLSTERRKYFSSYLWKVGELYSETQHVSHIVQHVWRSGQRSHNRSRTRSLPNGLSCWTDTCYKRDQNVSEI